MRSTIEHSRHPKRTRSDIAKEFLRPATALEKSKEYEEFTDVATAVQWLENAAKLFGEVHSSGSVQTSGGFYRDFNEIEPGTTRLANKLQEYGISASYHNARHLRYGRDKRGNLDENKYIGEAKWSSAFDLTDGQGTSGGVYTFRSKGGYNKQLSSFGEYPEPDNATYEISYATDGSTGYEFETGATYSIGKDATNLSLEDSEKFLSLASNFKNVLISKLAMLDGNDYRQLERIVEYGPQ